MSKKYVQTNTFYLAGSGVIVGATSIVLTSFTDIYGNVLTMTDFGDTGYITLEPDTTNEEAATFTGVVANANNTYTLTGVKTNLAKSPYTETSGLVRPHSGGTKVVVTDNVAFWNTFGNKFNTGTWSAVQTFATGATPVITDAPINPTDASNKAYIDGVAIAGAPKATETVYGITKLSVAAVSPTAPIAVGDNDGRIPSQTENDALVGTSGTPSSTNKYVTNDDRSGNNMPIGSMTMYAGSSAPTGWLLCDASAVSRTTYASLFAIISTTYGIGDNSTTFNLPDMRGRIPVGVGTGTGGAASGTGLPSGGSALTAVARGTWKGEETHVVTIAEMPAHTHPGTYYTTGAGSSGPGALGLASNNGVTSGSSFVPSQGGDGAHNNIQPVMGVNFIIKAL